MRLVLQALRAHHAHVQKTLCTIAVYRIYYQREQLQINAGKAYYRPVHKSSTPSAHAKIDYLLRRCSVGERASPLAGTEHQMMDNTACKVLLGLNDQTASG